MILTTSDGHIDTHICPSVLKVKQDPVTHRPQIVVDGGQPRNKLPKTTIKQLYHSLNLKPKLAWLK